MSRQAPLKHYLGWDTSSSTGVVVAFDYTEATDTNPASFKMISESTMSFETSRHSERLLWAIDTILKNAGWTLQDLSGFVVGAGPGSFTGLRIGITTARILANELKIPIFAISSLNLLARGVVSLLEENSLIIACTDATKGEWFTLLSTRDELLNWTRHPLNEKAQTAEDAFLEAQRVLSQQQAPIKQWVAVGNSTLRYEDEFAVLPQERRVKFSDPKFHMAFHQVKSSTLAQLGFEAISAGFKQNSLDFYPRYLRESEPEVKLKKGILKPQKLQIP